jgi:hypothetical protein
MVEQLAAVAEQWPVLLSLVNGLLRRRMDCGQPTGEAAGEIVRRLTIDGRRRWIRRGQRTGPEQWRPPSRRA